MGGRRSQTGFSLLETMIALALVAVAMTGLLVAFIGSGKFGVLARRQANAVALAHSIAADLDAAPFSDARLANGNVANDATFADAAGKFALANLPTAADAPDTSLGTIQVGGESYDAYVNVAADGSQGVFFAVIVRYRVGAADSGVFMRAVVLGYRYNPAAIGVGALPI